MYIKDDLFPNYTKELIITLLWQHLPKITFIWQTLNCQTKTFAGICSRDAYFTSTLPHRWLNHKTLMTVILMLSALQLISHLMNGVYFLHHWPPLTGLCMLVPFPPFHLQKIFLSELTLVGLNANRLRQAKTDSDSLLHFSRILPGLYHLR